MKAPKCPTCGHLPLAAFFRPSFKCSQCGANLSSNLRLVSLIEWLIGSGIFVLIVFALHERDTFRSRSYVELMSLLFLPACLIHAAVLVKFVRLQSDNEPSSN